MASMLDSCESLNSPVSKTLLNCHRKSDILPIGRNAKTVASGFVAIIPDNASRLIVIDLEAVLNNTKFYFTGAVQS